MTTKWCQMVTYIGNSVIRFYEQHTYRSNLPECSLLSSYCYQFQVSEDKTAVTNFCLTCADLYAYRIIAIVRQSEMEYRLVTRILDPENYEKMSI